jgi:hypothetical protein
MSEQQEYCVAAKSRATGKRIAITGPCDKPEAEAKKAHFNASSAYKKLYKYFHVAKYPYKVK